eukprot:TRINITY_DN101931_c0_g1_i1.p1 TRINITY_DN101931_c0_g1~~TRINITY_DN101931_c0_g1_i1.p1  ORF type:complete len:203 (-),score=18.99 TRINITY_DN101931_c0_g1_i1:199-807(-)
MQPTGDYEITLERKKDAETVGVTIVPMSDQTYQVVEVKREGLIPAWNSDHTELPQRMVKLGDRILGVNGVFGSVDLMVQELRRQVIVCAMKRGNGTVMPPSPESGGLWIDSDLDRTMSPTPAKNGVGDSVRETPSFDCVGRLDFNESARLASDPMCSEVGATLLTQSGISFGKEHVLSAVDHPELLPRGQSEEWACSRSCIC